ncbi:MAG: UDP-galactopyranose mutase, partial [Clostridia bacterium]|nr:UDP-galactopyranose mutase [Clostridia bacterium]
YIKGQTVEPYGVLVHKYGPHIFHTNNEKVWDFVNRFEDWKPFKLVCGAAWDGKYTPTAFNFKTIDTFYSEEDAKKLKEKLLAAYPGRESATVVEVLQHEDPDIRGYAEYLFENDYAPYTAKQWGISPEEIDPSVLKRVPLRFSYNESYFTDTYEAMPCNSYTRLFENLLQHENITLKLGVEAKDKLVFKNGRVTVAEEENFDVTVIYTGALDELFDLQHGELPYRSLRFEWKHEDVDSFQEAPVVAYPKEPGFTRITEYKKLPLQDVKGTTYAVEYPLPYIKGQTVEPYYPVLTESSQQQYDKYRKLAEGIENLVCCGRLADFKYYNMDQAIEAAMKVVDDLLK